MMNGNRFLINRRVFLVGGRRAHGPTVARLRDSTVEWDARRGAFPEDPSKVAGAGYMGAG